MPILIRNWWVEHHPEDDYLAPEQCPRICLCGEVDAHTRPIRTSEIVASDRRLVVTKNGSLYELGAPKAEYLGWLASNGIPFDEAHPIKVEPQEGGAGVSGGELDTAAPPNSEDLM